MNVNLLSGKFNMAAVYLATPNMSQVPSKYQKEIKRLNLFFSQIIEILKVTFPKLHQLSSVDSSQNNLMKIWRSDSFTSNEGIFLQAVLVQCCMQHLSDSPLVLCLPTYKKLRLH